MDFSPKRLIFPDGGSINLANNEIGYVSLNKLTIPQTFTITPGNCAVSTLMTALNAAFAAGIGNFENIIVIYSDI